MYMYTYLQLHKGETCLARPSFKNFVKRQSKVQTFPSINLFLRHYLDILCMIFYWMQYITLFGTVTYLHVHHYPSALAGERAQSIASQWMKLAKESQGLLDVMTFDPPSMGTRS